MTSRYATFDDDARARARSETRHAARRRRPRRASSRVRSRVHVSRRARRRERGHGRPRARASGRGGDADDVGRLGSAVATLSNVVRRPRLALGWAHASANVKSVTSACLMPLPSPGSGSILESIIVHFFL